MAAQSVPPISWVYVEDLDLTFRWVRNEWHQDVLRGNWRDGAAVLVERVPTGRTWVDNREVFDEANAYLRWRHPDWFRGLGPLAPSLTASEEALRPRLRTPMTA